MTRVFAVQALLLVLLHQTLGWYSKLDQPFSFRCPAHQFLSRIKSIHDNGAEDRVFDFECRPLADTTSENCVDLVDVNDFDQPLIFQCPHAGAITGISSHHDNHAEDRRYGFRCCESQGKCMVNCHYTGFKNSYDHELDYTVEDGYVLRGVSSIHNNHAEDRIFDFEVCEYREC